MGKELDSDKKDLTREFALQAMFDQVEFVKIFARFYTSNPNDSKKKTDNQLLIKIHLTRHTKEILIISNTNASPSSTFAHVYALSRISTQMREAQKIRGRRRFAWIANCINKTCWNPKSDLTKAPFFQKKIEFSPMGDEKGGRIFSFWKSTETGGARNLAELRQVCVFVYRRFVCRKFPLTRLSPRCVKQHAILGLLYELTTFFLRPSIRRWSPASVEMSITMNVQVQTNISLIMSIRIMLGEHEDIFVLQ